MQPTLNQLEELFTAACQRAAAHFDDRCWSFDPNLYAFEVRKDVYEALKRTGSDVAKVDGEDGELKVQNMSLCGLLLKKPLVHLRIRKSQDGEVPRADSGHLEDFYQWNLFSFPVESDKPIPLHLMLLWDADVERNLKRFWLGCPKADGVQWHWCVPIALGAANLLVDSGEAFREAFEAANSDVPMTPRAGNESVKHLTGTDDSAAK